MKMNDYQVQAMNFAIFKDEYKVMYPVLGLVNEAGEVAGKIKKVMRDTEEHVNEDGSLKDKTLAAIQSELGDVLWYLSVTAANLGMSLEDVANGNLTKLSERASRGTIGGSGDTR